MPFLKYNEFLNQFESIKNSPLYYFFGPEIYLKEEIINNFEKNFNGKETYYGNEITANSFLNLFSTENLFSNKTLIIIKNSEKIKESDKIKKFIDFIDFKKINNTIIFTTDEMFKKIDLVKNTLIEKISEVGYVIEFKPLSEKEITNWIIKKIQKYNKRISYENANYLYDNVGGNLYDIENEINKLILYVEEKQIITIDDINNVCSYIKHDTFYSLNDAILLKDKKNALKILNNIMNTDKDNIYILNSIYKSFLLILKAKIFLQEKLSEDIIFKKLKIHPYYGKIFLNRIEKYSLKELIEKIKLIHTTDFNIKTGRENSDLFLLVIKLCS